MAATYVHLSGRDLDDVLLKLHRKVDIINEIKENEEEFRVKTYPRCKEENSPTAIYCNRCSFVLDSEEAENIAYPTEKIPEYLFHKCEKNGIGILRLQILDTGEILVQKDAPAKEIELMVCLTINVRPVI